MQQYAPKHLPISPIHAMMGMLEVQKDARRINEIVNHPDVYPWVRGPIKGELDLTAAINSGAAICLLGKHGGIMFLQLQPGLYEAHTQVMPEGRGAWALDCVRACLMWLFSRTDAMEVVTRCPKGNLPALVMAKAAGLSLEFTNPNGWVMDDKPVAADIYRLTIQDWMRSAPALSERGEWFHRRFKEETEKRGKPDISHPDDDIHDRYVGAACEMVFGGQLAKAEALYMRFAAVAGYVPFRVVSLVPLLINTGNAVLEIHDGDFSIVELIGER